MSSFQDLRLVCRTDANQKGEREFHLTWNYQKIHGDLFDCRSAWKVEKFADATFQRVPFPNPFGDWERDEWRRMMIEAVDPAIEAWEAEKALSGNAPANGGLECISLPDFDAGDYRIEYLIRNVVPQGECGMIAAPFKGCKTHTAADMALSIATAQPFLGCNLFGVDKPLTSLFVSCESGKPATQETLRRICRARACSLRKSGTSTSRRTARNYPAKSTSSSD
ncbi:MAG: AAA family ATPase [Pirellulales bacterium]